MRAIRFLMLTAVFLPQYFAAAADNMILFYDKPAAEWVEAMPIGNGRIGAMIFGRPDNELIQFNEDTFWTRAPYDPANPNAFAALPEARQLVFEDKAKEAQNLIDEKMMGAPPWQAEYQPAGQLNLIFEGHQQATDYRRQLNLGTAVSMVGYKVGNVTFRRQIFSTPVDQVTVIRLTADKYGSINFIADFNAAQDRKRVYSIGDDTLALEVYAKGSDSVLKCHSRGKSYYPKRQNQS
jgi:alpha-L-fucosidase 2